MIVCCGGGLLEPLKLTQAAKPRQRSSNIDRRIGISSLPKNTVGQMPAADLHEPLKHTFMFA
jgi:hypothetical protein